ncbi:hypothetical protein PG994_006956 [Apiospora phragmitis]|uniref:Uncharacterized protein n=1 Tax=Apiospora phragmitis TaxID=2905665 RepID=A0ABR1VJE4_9PEZI
MFSSQSNLPRLQPLWGAAAHTTTPDHTFPPTQLPPHAGFHPDQGMLGSSPPSTAAGQTTELEYKLDMLHRKLNEIQSELRSYTGELERL